MPRKMSKQVVETVDVESSMNQAIETSASSVSEKSLTRRTIQVRAGECPRNKKHSNTRVYRTAGRIRYCICDDCGETWKMFGPEATQLIPQPDTETSTE